MRKYLVQIMGRKGFYFEGDDQKIKKLKAKYEKKYRDLKIVLQEIH